VAKQSSRPAINADLCSREPLETQGRKKLLTSEASYKDDHYEMLAIYRTRQNHLWVVEFARRATFAWPLGAKII